MLHQITDLTLFIADIALLAPFIPTATEVCADIACKRKGISSNVSSISKTNNKKCLNKFRESDNVPGYESLYLSSVLDYFVNLLFVAEA